jgi:hypothetical protein
VEIERVEVAAHGARAPRAPSRIGGDEPRHGGTGDESGKGARDRGRAARARYGFASADQSKR